MRTIEDRRAFLHGLGISVPVFAASTVVGQAATGNNPFPPARPPPRDPRDPIIRPDEVFMIYVSEALSQLPLQFARDPGSVVRMITEAQAAGLAAVIMELERRQ